MAHQEVEPDQHTAKSMVLPTIVYILKLTSINTKS